MSSESPMTFNVAIVNGEKVVTDAAGNQYPWVHSVAFTLMPDGQPMLYIGTTDFSSSFTVGASAGAGATPASPAPATAALAHDNPAH